MPIAEVLPGADNARTATRHPVDLLKAYKLRVQHKLTYQQIADAIGQPKSSIHQALQELCGLIDDPERLVIYEDARPAIMTLLEERLIGSLADPEAITKASLNNRAYAFKQIHEARRLETGQSTANVSILGKLIAAAEEKLGASASTQPSKAAGQAAENV
jgi:hypothetical protein